MVLAHHYADTLLTIVSKGKSPHCGLNSRSEFAAHAARRAYQQTLRCLVIFDNLSHLR